MNNIEFKLFEGEQYGSIAKYVYEQFVLRLDFDKYKSNNFERNKKLYMAECTKEGFGVWFLAYSNYNEAPNPYRINWKNEFINQDDVIVEHWEKPDVYGFSINDNLDTRVVFAKKDNGYGSLKYYFLGVYKYEYTLGNDRYFRRISKVYPMN